MTQPEILEELKKLTPTERLMVVEAALRLIREDLGQLREPLPRTQREQQLAMAARALLHDYTTDDELTIFTALDSEDFYAEG